MLEKAGKFVAKKALYAALNIAAPGTGTLLKKADQILNVANQLGPKATPENVEAVVDFMDNAGEIAKNAAGNVLDFLF